MYSLRRVLLWKDLDVWIVFNVPEYLFLLYIKGLTILLEKHYHIQPDVDPAIQSECEMRGATLNITLCSARPHKYEVIQCQSVRSTADPESRKLLNLQQTYSKSSFVFHSGAMSERNKRLKTAEGAALAPEPGHPDRKRVLNVLAQRRYRMPHRLCSRLALKFV